MLHAAVILEFRKVLGNLSGWFDKAVTHATAKKYDPELLLQSRLAPDQFALLRQVLTACDAAKLGAARLTGKTAPSHPDTEKTIAELRARIQWTIEYLDGFTEAELAGAEERLITTPRWEGRTLTGLQYANQHLIPNFYFHVAMTYAILRHNGVDVGKGDFLGPLPFAPPQA